MNYFETTELPRLAGWGKGFAEALAVAQRDFSSAYKRPRRSKPRPDAEDHTLRVDLRIRAFQMKMTDPEGFATLDRDLRLDDFLRGKWRPDDTASFVARFDDAASKLTEREDEEVDNDENELDEEDEIDDDADEEDEEEEGDRDRRPDDPIPVFFGNRDELTANQGALFARCVADEAVLERSLLTELADWYAEGELLFDQLFARQPGEALYLPANPTDDDFRRLAIIHQVHLAPSKARLAIVYQVPYLLDPGHGDHLVAVVDETGFVYLGDGDDLGYLT